MGKLKAPKFWSGNNASVINHWTSARVCRNFLNPGQEYRARQEQSKSQKWRET